MFDRLSSSWSLKLGSQLPWSGTLNNFAWNIHLLASCEFKVRCLGLFGCCRAFGSCRKGDRRTKRPSLSLRRPLQLRCGLLTGGTPQLPRSDGGRLLAQLRKSRTSRRSRCGGRSWSTSLLRMAPCVCRAHSFYGTYHEYGHRGVE